METHSIDKTKHSQTIDTVEKIMSNQQAILIFIVDDDPLYLKNLEFQFKENPNLVIKTFLTGEACIEKLSLKPDIIILDYLLNPKDDKTLDGIPTLVKIKNVSPSTQVIMLSSNESAEVATNSLKLGAFDYVVKDQKTYLNLKKCIKKVLSVYSKEKELVVWDW